VLVSRVGCGCCLLALDDVQRSFVERQRHGKAAHDGHQADRVRQADQVRHLGLELGGHYHRVADRADGYQACQESGDDEGCGVHADDERDDEWRARGQ